MRDKVRAIPEPPPEAPPADEQGAQGAPAAAAAPAQAVKATSPEDVENAVRANGGSIVEAAAILRAAEPTRAWAYKLQRWGAWITI